MLLIYVDKLTGRILKLIFLFAYNRSIVSEIADKLKIKCYFVSTKRSISWLI